MGHSWVAARHKAELVVQAVGQNTSEIVFNNRIEDGEDSHVGSDLDQHPNTRKSTCEGIDGQFGCEGAQKNRPSDGRIWISVLNTVVKEGKGTLDSKCYKDQF